ncbi:MAG TPA: hypothetical protein VG756_17640 [Pseudonocardiaceae bacterium]|jgi:hypothetical protein|nr:hypothetical protein [Pseudonocardiaceae bacterium]
MAEQHENPGTVANPRRTNVQRPADPDRQLVDETPSPGHDPTDQPWPEVAAEVKRAVEDADGPAKGHG